MAFDSKAHAPKASRSKPVTPQSLGMERLAESGLNGADSKLMGLTFLEGKAVAKLDAAFKDRPAMRIPYFDAKGKATGFYRIRYLGAATGLEALARKPQRYSQPSGTSPELYMPRGVPWDRIAGNAGMPLWITEGEIKAQAACGQGIPTLGLGGVYSWRASKAGKLLIPALAQFDWAGRQVFLAFDSDLNTNPDVLRALVSLSKELCSRGAACKMVQIPDGKDGKKQGIDDFIVAQGKKAQEALADLADEAATFSQAEELWTMNEEVVYVKDPGLVIVKADGRKMAPRAFKDHAYSNRFYLETSVDKQGNQKTEKKPLAPAWLIWEKRAELERVTYAPGEGRVTAAREYNYWPGWGCEPRKGDIRLWHELMGYMFGKNVGTRKWFEQWCAYPIQHPGAKLYSAAVVWGVKTGTGKSLMGYSLMKIYGRNSTEINDEQIASPYNEWAENKQFIMGDDVKGSEKKKDTADHLKFMITRHQLRLNPKYIPSYVVPDCINYYFTSNHPDAMFVEDDDRRYFVHEAPDAPYDRPGFYKEYDHWLKDPQGLGPALFHYMLSVDLTGFDPNGRAFETRAKRAMVADAKSDVAAWVGRLAEDPDGTLRLGDAALSKDVYSTAQLLSLYDPEGRGRVTANGLGRELKKAGFRQVLDGQVVAAAGGAARFYAVRNARKWLSESHHAIAAHLAGEEETKKKGGKY